MKVVLVMFRPDGQRRSFSVTRDVTLMGRREDCDFRIPLGEISRKHCRLLKQDGAVMLEDLGSSNGTYHNGLRVSQTVELAPGDSISLGSVTFVLQVDGVPAEDEMFPALTGGAGMGAGMEDSGLMGNADGLDLEPVELESADDSMASAPGTQNQR